MGEATAITPSTALVKPPRQRKYAELYDIVDTLDIVSKASDTGWVDIKFPTRHDGFLLRCALTQYKTGIQTEANGTRWKFQTRVRYPFQDRRTIFSFRKIEVQDDQR